MKHFIFSLAILTSVALALVFPDIFSQVGSFSLTSLIIPLLMLIMFSMGVSLSIKDFAGIISMPKGVLVGLICQFSVMPFLGVTLAIISGLPPEIAAGIILVGCSPGGLASNVMAYISGANLALSLTLTTFSTLLAPFMTPFLMANLADQYLQINAYDMFWSISQIVLFPVIAGLLFNHLAHQRLAGVVSILPKISMLGIILVIAIITAAGRDALVAIGLTLVIVVIAHNLFGIGLGYIAARFAKLPEADARAIAFEVGMQNSGLASGIAVSLGKVATLGLAPAVFSPFMNIVSSLIASYWRERPIQVPSDDLNDR